MQKTVIKLCSYCAIKKINNYKSSSCSSFQMNSFALEQEKTRKDKEDTKLTMNKLQAEKESMEATLNKLTEEKGILKFALENANDKIDDLNASKTHLIRLIQTISVQTLTSFTLT